MAAQRLDICAQKEDIYAVHNQYISARRDTGIAGHCTITKLYNFWFTTYTRKVSKVNRALLAKDSRALLKRNTKKQYS